MVLTDPRWKTQRSCGTRPVMNATLGVDGSLRMLRHTFLQNQMRVRMTIDVLSFAVAREFRTIDETSRSRFLGS